MSSRDYPGSTRSRLLKDPKKMNTSSHPPRSSWRAQTLWLVVVIVAFASGAAPSPAQEEPASEDDSNSSSYGNTPHEMVPYGRTGDYYWRYYEEPTPFRGTGREAPPPEGLSAVKVGLIAPLDHPLDSAVGEEMLWAARLAVEEANAAGGFRQSIPYVLVVRNDSGLWGATSNTFVELAWSEKVFGVIGSLDAANTHIALRVALKAEVPMVNTASTDPTMTETAIPWLLRCYPDDRQHGYRLAQLLFTTKEYRHVAVMRSNDKYGRMGVGEFIDAARRLGRPLPLEVRYKPGERDFEAQLQRIGKVGAEAVVLWSNAADAAAIVKAMRESGLDLPVYGTDRLSSDVFIEKAGSAAEGVIITSPLDPSSERPQWLEFRDRFRKRHDRTPSAFGAFTYDGTRILLQAIERGGLNRVRIRDELAAFESFEGCAGPMRFDATHNNLGMVHLLEVRHGKLSPISQ